MADTVQFVDAIEQTPNVLLDLNDEVSWSTRSFEAPTPRLRRAVSSNAMRDGIFVSSSQYDARTLTIVLDLVTTDQDANALELQKLFRILDAPSILRYRPQGATKPVFFKVYRSDAAGIVDVIAAAAFRQPQIELLAEPFALGLMETAGPFTVTNDPDDANGMFFDLDSVIGDVSAPLLMWSNDATAGADYLFAVEPSPGSGALDEVYMAQAEDATVGTDTTVPGGGPDAAMSGTGTNNYATTSFTTTATMAARLTGLVPATVLPPGLYSVYARVRPAGTLPVLRFRLGIRNNSGSATYSYTEPVTPSFPTSSARLIRLGAVNLPYGQSGRVGPGLQLGQQYPEFSLEAQRVSGTGGVDLDYLLLVPAKRTGIVTMPNPIRTTVLDAEQDDVHVVSGDPTSGATTAYQAVGAAISRAGSLPEVVPDQVNRIHVVGINDTTAGVSIWRVAYWPRYLTVRPTGS